MTFLTGLWVVIVFTLCCTVALIAAATFVNGIWQPYKNQQAVHLSFTELLSIFNTIINSELQEYERDIFSDKGSITNSNFESFYKDLTSKIVAALSPKFIEQLSLYLTEDMIYRYVARAVKEYLLSKINGVV